MAYTPQSSKLDDLLRYLNNFHKFHGFTVLFDEKKSKLRKLYEASLVLAVFIYTFCYILASTERFSDNGKFDRSMFRFMAFTGTYVFFIELFYWKQKSEILSLVKWCHWVEMYKPKQRSGLVKPHDWFQEKRNRIFKFVQ